MATDTHASSVAVVRPETTRLDAVSGREMVRQLRPYVELGSDVVLNLEQVEFINSEALGYITMSCRRIHHRRGHLAICCLQPELHKIFQVTRLTELVDGIFDTELAAITAFQSTKKA